MRSRSLSVAALTALLLLPLGPAAAGSAAASEPTATAVTATFKTSAFQRLKRAARPVAAPVPALSVPTYADRVLVLTNAERTGRGLAPLAFSPCADGYADSWATSLAQRGSLAHQALAPILSACGASRVAENVAYGSVTPEQLVGMWMASDGHRRNILHPAHTHLGVGAVPTATGRVYGVQVFVRL